LSVILRINNETTANIEVIINDIEVYTTTWSNDEVLIKINDKII